jgi:exodeoxyribonuclease V alpha subunit
VPDAPRRADPDTDVSQLRDNYDKSAAGVFDGTVDVVTGISLEEQRPNMNLDFTSLSSSDMNLGFHIVHANPGNPDRGAGGDYVTEVPFLVS